MGQDRCPICDLPGEATGQTTYRMASGEVTIVLRRCGRAHRWTTCPWCGALAQLADRRAFASSDAFGRTAIEFYECTEGPNHRWPVALEEDDLGFEDIEDLLEEKI